METVIVICLLIIILLLLHDKVVIQISSKSKVAGKTADKTADNENIIGKPKSIPVIETLDNTTQGNEGGSVRELPDFGEQTEQEQQDEMPLPQEADDGLFDEEMTAGAYGDSDFSESISYPELTQVTAIMKEGVTDQAQHEQAVQLVQKVQGTELYDMLENSIEGASKRIAELLDKTLTGSENKVSNHNTNDFDIEEFI